MTVHNSNDGLEDLERLTKLIVRQLVRILGLYQCMSAEIVQLEEFMAWMKDLQASLITIVPYAWSCTCLENSKNSASIKYNMDKTSMFCKKEPIEYGNRPPAQIRVNGSSAARSVIFGWFYKILTRHWDAFDHWSVSKSGLAHTAYVP